MKEQPSYQALPPSYTSFTNSAHVLNSERASHGRENCFSSDSPVRLPLKM